ncbi:MAG: hypothetical protein HYZ47_03600 [Simkania negevensis]|nr:hypothetical protein [Simkania negevensis]
MNFFSPSLIFLISFIIVAFGQPSRSLVLSILASCIGYGLCFISLLEVRKRKNRFLLAGAWFTLVQMVELGWLATPEYHGWYIIFVYLLLSLFLGLQFALLSLFLSQYLKWDRILFLTSLWTLFEWGRLFIFCGFSWNPVGLALTAPLYPSQMASLGGIFFLSFWVILVNLLFLKGYLERRKKGFLTWGALALFPYFFGFCHLSFHEREQQGKEMLHVALLQTGLRVEEKVFFGDRSTSFVSPYTQWEKILGYLEQKERGRPLDLIVLPEAALPFSANSPVYFYEEVVKIFAKKWGKSEGELDLLLKYPFAVKKEMEKFQRVFRFVMKRPFLI